ncbi:hypothetical protein Rsub_08492 [Raphidocelis subcapitata]|uniref:Protein VACUOLELESS1 n=1 Tax=Raphidocelis subcapitata TaxID=307507 RepID=A0A2V0P7R3_9CHLO|nr:hypothetical protein Rsub_08492 [Raphidocelis subcapitata]|eukprot:GBF95901.1 hypothetical protein Rsub_08492 [Raphidocelis subcapitata]
MAQGSAPSGASAMRAEAVGDWEAAGAQFFSRELLYDMQWRDADLETKRVAAAPFGGPIATLRDERAVVPVRGAGPARPVVRLFSAAGAEAGSFLWERGRLAGWGWSDAQELVIVEPSGKVQFYSPQGVRLPKELSFGPEVQSEGVAATHVWGDGVVVLSAATGQLWAAVGLAEPRAARLAPVPGLTAGAPPPPPPAAAMGGGAAARPGSSGGGAAGGAAAAAVSAVTDAHLAVIRPEQSLSRCLEVLVACGGRVWSVDEGAATEAALPPGAGGAAALAVAPGGGFVAAFCGDGRLRVFSSDFSRVISEFDTASAVPPIDLAWCGVDAVAMRWEGLLLLAGPYGDWLRMPASGPMVLVPEVDGLRAITEATHVLLRRVAEPLLQVYRPGSTAPAAALWDARDLWDAASARADRLLRELGTAGIGEAVRACIEAAGLDLSPPRQRALLRAAAFGRPFAGPNFPPLALRGAARVLRVLNAVRDPAVGVPLTAAQLEALTLPVLVSRLVSLRHHLLAYRIAEMLGEGRETVAAHWACAKISASPSVPDAALRDALLARLRGVPGAHYAPIAAHAQARARGAPFLSLSAAVLGLEPDLLHTIYSTQGLAAEASELTFHQALRAFEEVASGAEAGPAAPPAGGAGARPDAAAAARLASGLERAAAEGRREGGLVARAAGEFGALVKEQMRLERETGHSLFVGLSLSDTLRTALRLGHAREAAAVRRQFAVPEPRWQWIKLQSLVEARDWEALDVWAAEKIKGPLMGWDAVLGAAQRGGAPREYQSRLIGRMPDSAKKAEAFAAIDCAKEAAEVAARIRDNDLFARIQAAVAPGSAAGLAIAGVRERFASLR